MEVSLAVCLKTAGAAHGVLGPGCMRESYGASSSGATELYHSVHAQLLNETEQFALHLASLLSGV